MVGPGYHAPLAGLCFGDDGRARGKTCATRLERELAKLGDRHDLAMSEFKFDEAREVQQRIDVLERERGELAEALPAPAPPPPPQGMVRARRLSQRRRRTLRR